MLSPKGSAPRRIKSILIANRSEIAIRVMRAATELGKELRETIRAVAIDEDGGDGIAGGLDANGSPTADTFNPKPWSVSMPL